MSELAEWEVLPNFDVKISRQFVNSDEVISSSDYRFFKAVDRWNSTPASVRGAFPMAYRSMALGLQPKRGN